MAWEGSSGSVPNAKARALHRVVAALEAEGIRFSGAPQPPARPVLGANWWYKMTRTELIIQLLKVVIGLAFGAYFVWWSLEVLDRLTPEHEVPAAVVGRAF
jgi:hypothetical protein